MEIYNNIRRLRKEKKMSQQELAEKTGYTDRSSIAKIEHGEVDLPQSKIILFAKALDVSPGELMGDDGIIQPEVATIQEEINKMGPDQLNRLISYAKFLNEKGGKS